MDITLQELKTMKAKQLRRLIREAIAEVLAEDSVVTKDTPSSKIGQIAKGEQVNPNDVKSAIDQAKKTGKSVTIYGKSMNENELAEAKTYRLTDPNFDTSAFADRRIRGIAVSDMLNWIKDNPGVSARRFKEQFGFPKEQGANAFLNAFHQSGILTKLGSGGDEITVRQPAAPGEEEESDEVVTGPEALFVGKGDPLAQYFDNVPNADGEEDFNAEEEPTVGDIVPGVPAPASSMSKEDYDAFMDYTDLADRLAATKSNILKLKRSKKGGVAGDIRDTEGTDIARLEDLKNKIQKQMDALVAKSDYLKKRTGQTVEPIEEPEIEDEDTIDEAFDAEYEKRKLQFYAGIIK